MAKKCEYDSQNDTTQIGKNERYSQVRRKGQRWPLGNPRNEGQVEVEVEVEIQIKPFPILAGITEHSEASNR